jgi:hypothetical protein
MIEKRVRRYMQKKTIVDKKTVLYHRCFQGLAFQLD